MLSGEVRHRRAWPAADCRESLSLQGFSSNTGRLVADALYLSGGSAINPSLSRKRAIPSTGSSKMHCAVPTSGTGAGMAPARTQFAMVLVDTLSI